jgi:hypothetical protein
MALKAIKSKFFSGLVLYINVIQDNTEYSLKATHMISFNRFSTWISKYSKLQFGAQPTPLPSGDSSQSSEVRDPAALIETAREHKVVPSTKFCSQ